MSQDTPTLAVGTKPGNVGLAGQTGPPPPTPLAHPAIRPCYAPSLLKLSNHQEFLLTKLDGPRVLSVPGGLGPLQPETLFTNKPMLAKAQRSEDRKSATAGNQPHRFIAVTRRNTRRATRNRNAKPSSRRSPEFQRLLPRPTRYDPITRGFSDEIHRRRC